MSSVASELAAAVAEFGAASKEKLAGPGDREAAIRSPLESLLRSVGNAFGTEAVFHDEVRDTTRRVRPDYGVSVDRAMIGYLEVKAPGRRIDPSGFTGHDLEQWNRQKDLPNLIYTNGTQWRLYRDGEPFVLPVDFEGGSLTDAGSGLNAPPAFETLIRHFLSWKPEDINSVGVLVRAIAPLTRLLRGEVLDQLAEEQRAISEGSPAWEQPFMGLAADWRNLLFPQADDHTFADGYAQTVTFALLLAKTENMTLEGRSLHQVGAELDAEHSLMGRALQLLTDNVQEGFAVTLSLLVRVIDSVNWRRVRSGRRDMYLHLYENFLDEYDPELRKRSGSYYTPREVVDEMVRLTEEILVTRLDRPAGFLDEGVITIDPAMGTGTFLHTIIERSLERVEQREGAGAVPGAATSLAKSLIGFELQMGPFAVAELRAADLFREKRARLPEGGLKFYVTDTLDNPRTEQTRLGSGLERIAASRRAANVVKSTTPVTVVIGNPPYGERAEGLGGWIEQDDPGLAIRAPLNDFKDPDMARHAHNLKNLYVYFWRWATWKVFESTPAALEGDAGIVCFITTSGYLGGPGFTGMREYLRRHSSEGWIIDLTPEGQRSDVRNRIFPGVQQPLAIGIFVRRSGTSLNEPARILYQTVEGTRTEKFTSLSQIAVDGEAWKEARTAWTSSFFPAPESSWDSFPALNDIFPWSSPGVTGNRTWPFNPSRDVLKKRWLKLVGESDASAKADMLKPTRDRSLDKVVRVLPGVDTAQEDLPLRLATPEGTKSIRMGFRSFDRQWVLADNRVLDMARPPLWDARISGQVFVIEQHSKAVTTGPGLVFSALMPELNYFDNRGGRTLPLFHPNGRPNLARGLLDTLTARFSREITAEDIVAYVAAIASHPGFTSTFEDELTTPGIRIPITADPALFQRATSIGRELVWLHSYGESFADDANGRPEKNIRFPSGDPLQPLSRTSIVELPEDISFVPDPSTNTIATGAIWAGEGSWAPVQKRVFDYSVGGRNVVKSWFNYRKKNPGGRKSSPLDEITVEIWPSEWTSEFTDLLTALTRIVALETDQDELLEEILRGPLLTRGDLSAGAIWPTGATQRKPDYDRLGDNSLF